MRESARGAHTHSVGKATAGPVEGMQIGEGCQASGKGFARFVLEPTARDVESAEGAQLRQSVEKADDA